MAKSGASRANPWLLPILVGAVVIVAVGALLWGLVGGSESSADETPSDVQMESGHPEQAERSEQPAQQQEPQVPDLSFVERREATDPLAAGEVEAPVVMVIFSDYQCPYCAAWSQDTLPVMMDYVDAGQLRIEWRDLNVFGPPSERASRAGYAAGLQGEFWAFHDRLFADGQIRTEQHLTDEALLEVADELNLDVERFATDLSAAETHEQIVVNQRLGTDLGAYSTPSFLIGGEPLVGAQPTEVFVDAVERALSRN